MTKRLLASFLTLTVLVLIVLEVPLAITFADHERDRLTTEIERDAVVLSTFVEDALQERRPLDDAGVRRYAEETGVRVVVVDVDGIARVDTDPDQRPGRRFVTRPEIIDALAGRVATGTRHSDSLNTDLLYVAVPVASAGKVYGAVRVTYPTTEIDRRVGHYWWTLAGVAGVSLFAASALGIVLARGVAKPMRRLERAALALGGGDLRARVGDVGGPPVVRSVATVFDDMASRIDQLMTAQDAFVADASHQLRNPLTALRLRLENVGHDAPDEAQEDLRGALDEVARLSRMVDGLLVLARSGSDEVQHPTTPVDLTAIIRDREAAWLPLAEERGVALVADVDDDVVAIASGDHVRQVLDNLIANSLDAAPAGSSIDVTVAAVDGGVALHVVDDGPGLSEDERAHAFDRFWRATSTPSTRLGGSGLGLAIVRKLVLADGGDVELRAAPGGGLDAVVRYRSASASAWSTTVTT